MLTRIAEPLAELAPGLPAAAAGSAPAYLETPSLSQPAAAAAAAPRRRRRGQGAESRHPDGGRGPGGRTAQPSRMAHELADA